MVGRQRNGGKGNGRSVFWGGSTQNLPLRGRAHCGCKVVPKNSPFFPFLSCYDIWRDAGTCEPQVCFSVKGLLRFKADGSTSRGACAIVSFVLCLKDITVDVEQGFMSSLLETFFSWQTKSFLVF